MNGINLPLMPTPYEELPQWYIEKQKEEEKKKEENSQLEFDIPFGWTE